ncbi:hypothetical protein GOP47_0010283 [Adiantum capillus-veneris]|uniref:U3 small nucleolar RNA-associated protein 25 n=1 Tax=Adiantum capillus-veneris TaxID=13818 RepID=A0A9D4UVP8_ADICA|nr:hypothetical protein GOP47_0010283 [Adiantum capillus-veneris]
MLQWQKLGRDLNLYVLGQYLLRDKKSTLDDMQGESDGSISDGADHPISAYQALLGSLSVNGGKFSEAFAQRQKEEQGLSSSDGSGNSEEETGWGDVDESLKDSLNSAHPENEAGQVSVDQEGAAFGNGETAAKPPCLVLDGRTPMSIGVAESQEESEDEGAVPDDSYQNNSFKKHLEYNLTDKEVASLLKRGAKFRSERIASGIQKSKWLTTESDLPLEDRNLLSYGVKLRLKKSWIASHRGLLWGDFQSNHQCQFFSLCNSYRDILYSKRPSFYGNGDIQDQEIMDAYLLHVLNHVLKTRDLVTKNNEKKVAASDREAPRDQGFTRPKVLILLPLRSMALRLVKRLLDMVPAAHKGTTEHKERFFDEFGAEDDGSDEDAAEKAKSTKPTDFNALFRGNNDDHFRIGMKFTRKSVKLYSDFYSSDLIVASPLGLITRIGEAQQEKDKDVDFLSSIEILVIDYADVILMQNWAHVTEIGEQLNQIPTQQNGTDFMRIRELFLNGHGRFFRQTLILSAFTDAGINAFFNRSCLNHAGKVKLRCEYPGVLSKMLLQVRQVYERISCTSLTDVDEARFKLFTKQIFGPLKESLQGGIMIFVSAYFDFVRLRNFLKAENVSFCLLGEYTKQSDISRARAWFFHGKRRLMLYTERAHFYHRYKIRGIKELIFYSLPENAEFYAEITNMMEGLENPSSSVLFSQFDNLKLERVVGSSRAKRMLKSDNKTFMFC